MEPGRRTVRFGVFEVDLVAAELRKHGLRLRLQEQPFQVLAALLERPGEVVTREELVQRLWPDGTFVDFDRGLNAAVTRLRQALADSAETPRYVETVARRGYRLIAPVNDVLDSAAPAPTVSKPRAWIWPAVALMLTVLITLATWWARVRKGPADGTIDKPLTVSPLTTEPGSILSPTFSPDGNQVAFEWDQDKNEPRIFIKLVGPGEPVRLTSGLAAESSPAWSPDGKFVAFIRALVESTGNQTSATCGLFLVPALGGAERKLMEFACPHYYYPEFRPRLLDWMRDSRHLIASIPDGSGYLRLFRVSTDGEEKVPVNPPTNGGPAERDPAVSPDGHFLVFGREEAYGSANLYLLELTKDLSPAAKPRQLTSELSGRYAQTPVWTPDGHEIVYCSNRDGVPRLWRTGVEQGAIPRQVPSVGPDSYMPAVSQRGRLVFRHGFRDANIWRQELPSRSGTLHTPVSLIASTAFDSSPQYSPDGTRITFQSVRSGNYEIWICGSDGGKSRQMTSFNGPVTGTPRWSPDGKKIAFDSAAAGRFDIYVMDAEGGLSRRLTHESANSVIPSWSHDGKWIYFTSDITGRTEIWKVPISGGAGVQVTRNGGFTAFESPDGKTLYYTKSETSKLWKSGVDGSGESVIADSVVWRGFAVTANRIYYLRGEPGRATTLREITLATGKDALITTFAKPLELGLSVSADGMHVLYTQVDHLGSNLMLVENFH